jgi:flavin reductase (DIM6/NTAB) family NADH-FMN oxidoreductase RutF
MGSVDAAAFRAVLGQWPTGVTVVTTAVGDQRYGVTASSFSSVSLEPPLVSVCLARTAFAHDLVGDTGVFGVTILGKDHAELGRRFARFDPEGPDRFADEEWVTAKTGSPLLGTALGWLDCSVLHAHPGGDHTIFVGEVLAAATPRTTSPLLYHSRTWGQFADQLPDEVVLSHDAADDARTVDELLARHDVHARPRALVPLSLGLDQLGAAVDGLVAAGPSEVVLVDDGTATPVHLREACREAVLRARPVPVAVRLSEASGLGQANLLTALKSGVSRVAVGPGALSVDEVSRLVSALGLHLEGTPA